LEARTFISTISVYPCNLGECVACPFFMPDQRLEGDWPFPQRLPLGAGWSGTCRANADAEIRPSEEELKTACNLGYAQGCPRLPVKRHADAIRFALGEERDGLVQIRFACEREYLPAAHGDLIYETATRRWQTTHSDACLVRMAECYIEARLQGRKQCQPPLGSS